MNEPQTDLPVLADPVIPWRDSFVACSREFERLAARVIPYGDTRCPR